MLAPVILNPPQRVKNLFAGKRSASTDPSPPDLSRGVQDDGNERLVSHD